MCETWFWSWIALIIMQWCTICPSSERRRCWTSYCSHRAWPVHPFQSWNTRSFIPISLIKCECSPNSNVFQFTSAKPKNVLIINQTKNFLDTKNIATKTVCLKWQWSEETGLQPQVSQHTIYSTNEWVLNIYKTPQRRFGSSSTNSPRVNTDLQIKRCWLLRPFELRMESEKSCTEMLKEVITGLQEIKYLLDKQAEVLLAILEVMKSSK